MKDEFEKLRDLMRAVRSSALESQAVAYDLNCANGSDLHEADSKSMDADDEFDKALRELDDKCRILP